MSFTILRPIVEARKRSLLLLSIVTRENEAGRRNLEKRVSQKAVVQKNYSTIASRVCVESDSMCMKIRFGRQADHSPDFEMAVA